MNCAPAPRRRFTRSPEVPILESNRFVAGKILG